MIKLWDRRRRIRRPRRGPLAPPPSKGPARLPTRALLEFGASGARAALVRLCRDSAEILSAAEARGASGIARPGTVANHARLAELAERALSSAEHLAAGLEGLPIIADEAIIGLSGPMLDAQITVMHFPRQRPHDPVRIQELAEALLQIQQRALQALAERAAAIRIRHRHISAQLVGAVVDGERVSAPLNGHSSHPLSREGGKTLSIAVCNVTWPLAGLETIERLLGTLELEGQAFVPLPQAVAAAAPLADAILIDVGHEHTEVALAEGGVLSHFRAFPMGGAHFTAALSQSLRLSPKAAELAKQRYSVGQGTADARVMIGQVLAPVAATWRSALEQTLLDLAGRAPLPPHLFLYGGGSTVPDLRAELQTQPWTRRLPFQRQPEVEALTPQRLRGVRDPAGRLHGGGAVGLAALGAWAVREPTTVDRLLAGISAKVAAGVGLG